jgi:hypothetical protein
MTPIRRCELPQDALLRRYAGGGAYADCYATDVAWGVSHAQYVEAFYTTALFKAERLVLRWVVAKPSTDVDAGLLAAGARDSFAAWHVEARATDQLLLRDFRSRTRSWLMVAPARDAGADGTRLYFGSAVTPAPGTSSGPPALGLAFTLLLGLHKMYSRALLSAARSRLARQPDRKRP